MSSSPIAVLSRGARSALTSRRGTGRADGSGGARRAGARRWERAPRPACSTRRTTGTARATSASAPRTRSRRTRRSAWAPEEPRARVGRIRPVLVAWFSACAGGAARRLLHHRGRRAVGGAPAARAPPVPARMRTWRSCIRARLPLHTWCEERHGRLETVRTASHPQTHTGGRRSNRRPLSGSAPRPRALDAQDAPRRPRRDAAVRAATAARSPSLDAAVSAAHARTTRAGRPRYASQRSRKSSTTARKRVGLLDVRHVARVLEDAPARRGAGARASPP